MTDLSKWAVVSLALTEKMRRASLLSVAPEGDLMQAEWVAMCATSPTGPETPVLIDPARLRELERDAARLREALQALVDQLDSDAEVGYPCTAHANRDIANARAALQEQSR